MRRKRLAAAAALVAGLWIATTSGRGAGPKFYPDDPLWHDPETQDAASVRPVDLSGQYDFVENSFLGAGEHVDKRAVNVNTLDEVPDSTWFTNRLGRASMTLDELAKGPDTGSGPAAGPWTIVSGKTEGRSPGLTIRDATGQIYFIKFDPPSNPEMASGAEVIATKFLHAAGYHVPENYITTIHRESLVIGDQARVVEDGRKRPMRPGDIDVVLKKSAQNADGSYRVLASRGLEGTPVGPFRYYGTRPDDPNDIHPHEHRRELRGLLVLAAWLNHDDSRAVNTLDMLVRRDGRTVVRHHLIDFGSTLGSGSTRSQSTRAGNEFIWESRPTFITMLTLGFYVRPWLKVEYPDIPAVGRFEGTYFTPEDWKPEYANAAFENARPEDRFWGATIAARFSDDAVRAIVGTAKFSDSRATEYLTKVLVQRKQKVLNAWLNATNPVTSLALGADGVLTFDNAAEAAGVATAAQHYTVEWSAFDNAAGSHKTIGGEEMVSARTAQMPAALLAAKPEFVSARVRAFHGDHPAWSQPLVGYFRRAGSAWQLIGLERNP
jgi:hypothetical protein